MRRCALGLLFLLVVPAFTASWAARRPDGSSSSKGGIDNTCGPGDPALSSDPYSNQRFSLAQLSGTTTSGTTYLLNVDVYAWGEYNCPLYITGNPLSGQDPASEDTILALTVSTSTGTPAAGSYKLLSFRLNNYLPLSDGLGFISCQTNPNEPQGVVPCDNQNDDDISVVPEPAPISGADGNGSLWTFGDLYQLSSSTDPNVDPSTPIQLSAVTASGTADAALLVPGCPPNSSQNCIGSDGLNHDNGLSAQNTYTARIEDVVSGQVVVLGTPPSLQPSPGTGHDVFSASTYNPVLISAGTFLNQIFDLSQNYPQQDNTGVQTTNNLPPSAYPSPCATTAPTCTADDTFPNYSFHSVWFDFTPQNNTQVSVSTAGSHFDTILSIFTGTAGSLQNVPAGINDDNPNASLAQGPRSSAVIFQGTQGVPYHILVSEYPPQNPGAQTNSDEYLSPLSTDPIVYFTLTTPQLAPNPAMLQDFGSQTQGTTSTPQSVTLTAQYSGTPGITSVQAGISGDFQIAPNSTCGSSLTDGSSCALEIVFTPTAAGSRTGTLTVSSNAENSPLTISLSGTGVVSAPVLTLSTAPVSFGNQLLNTASETNSVVLTNSGTAPLTVSAVSATGDFSEKDNCSSVAAGGQCSVMVTFTPTQTGSRSGQLSITDNSGNSPQTIALSGTGTDFALQAATGSTLTTTVAAGATATYNLVVAPISGFTGMVTLTCSGAPAGGTCTPNPPSVNVNGSATSVTVSVTTSANASLAHSPGRLNPEARSFAVVMIPLGALTFIAGVSRRKKLFTSFTCLAAIFLAIWISGCGGGSSPQVQVNPPPPVTLMLAGVSGGQTRTVSLTLNFQ